MNCSTWEIVGESLRLVHSNVDRQQVGLWEFDCIFFNHVFDHPFWKIQLKISKCQKIQMIRAGLYGLTGLDQLRLDGEVHQDIWNFWKFSKCQEILINGRSTPFDWFGSTEVKLTGAFEYIDFLFSNLAPIRSFKGDTWNAHFVWQKWRFGSFFLQSNIFLDHCVTWKL